MVYQSVAVVAAALAPLLAVISAFMLPLLSSLLSNKRSLFAFIYSETVFLINAFLTILVYLYIHGTNNIIVYLFAGFPAPFGIIYEVDVLGAFFGLLIGLIFPLINIVSYSYLERSSKHNEWYYTLYLGLQAGMLGIAYTGDLFNLFVMLEVMSITAYGLTAYFREKGKPLNATIKYGLFGAVGSTIYFLAVVFLYSGIGTLAMPDAAAASMGLSYFGETTGLALNPFPVLILFAGLAVWAFMIESAVFPHHFWLPDAYSNMPSSVAATMAAVAEGIGAYVIIRILYVIVGIDKVLWLLSLLVILGTVNIIVGGYLMAVSRDAKRIIAYSTILDMGYVMIGIGLATNMGLQSALFYILAHTIVKPLLFIAVGEVEAEYKTTDIDKLEEIGGVDPYIASALLFGGLAVVGIPPLNMFFAKLMLFEAVLDSGIYPLLIVILLGSALSFVGFSRLWFVAIGYRRRSIVGKIARASYSAKVLIILLVLATILTGIFYNYLNEQVLSRIVESMFSSQFRYEYVKTAYDYLSQMLLRGG
ncbi:NADH/Ubiquinone/plastoquinone (complex I) [Staphylothermus marinus F1]|uniref:NADH/Ubiquinone/plastoquinone (Complex I) n=1 Tax=Staphylothermus marinus (strain ATCC 43588 / DSM 3639 / JCM 9404 / F1) TaxID=399550 RepID=A3DM91_STAMF|nr:proton-conducting transporter membrane subunit [Staphylothermus marinus]ABN69751.1 NADH/Ubiquinone/plastoquinone (complex I) [Staphylothermus marinus F1]